MQTESGLFPLEWESQFFGYPLARFVPGGEPLPSPEQMNRFRVVQAKVATDDYKQLDLLHQLGFQLAEGEAGLVIPLQQTERQPGISIARSHQIPALREAAAEAFVQSRFRDPWFTAEDSQRFYAQWIENAVTGQFDDQCLIACDPEGHPQGFVSVRDGAEEARIGLLAVLPQARGTGLGQRLLSAAADRCRARGMKRMHITTQLSNPAAMRLYLRCGARLENTAYWLYRKTDDSI